MGTKNTFLFIPNIIGNVRYYSLCEVIWFCLIDYGRALCIVLVCYYHDKCPLMTAFLYAFSQALDAFDGWAARKFNQCNKFGEVLDMVCDRVSDAIMLAILASLYPSISAVFLLAAGLDISSHWYQTYSTQYCRETHHKTADTEWKLLKIYYN